MPLNIILQPQVNYLNNLIENIFIVEDFYKLWIYCPIPKNALIMNNKLKIVRNEIPIYEIGSGAALAFAALLMILPGFLTDIIGLLIIFPWTRKMFLKKISKKNYKNKKNFIEGEYEDIEDNDDRKVY